MGDSEKSFGQRMRELAEERSASRNRYVVRQALNEMLPSLRNQVRSKASAGEFCLEIQADDAQFSSLFAYPNAASAMLGEDGLRLEFDRDSRAIVSW